MRFVTVAAALLRHTATASYILTLYVYSVVYREESHAIDFHKRDRLINHCIDEEERERDGCMHAFLSEYAYIYSAAASISIGSGPMKNRTVATRLPI